MKKIKKNNQGITLIALIITVIVMLILAAVAINMTIGDNGIFKKTADSADISKRENAREKLSLVLTDVQMRRIKEGESLALSEGMASEIQGYKDITSAKFTGTKIETVVDGYNFEVNGDLGIESKKEIAKVEPENLEDWEYRIESDGTATLLTYKGSATKVVVPNYIEGYWVKQVGSGEDKGNIWGENIVEFVERYESWGRNVQKTITEIVVSEGIEIIADYAFEVATALEKITFPRSVHTIGLYAIKLSNQGLYNNKLQEIKIYKNVENMGSSIFNGRDLIEVKIEYDENEIPSTWDSNWKLNHLVGEGDLNTTINYGVKM